MKLTMNRSRVSLSARIEEAVKAKEPEVKTRLIQIANSLTDLSPVWSGAYVTSHSFVPKGSGGGRMRKSDQSKGPLDPWAKRDEALALLIGDINRVDIMEVGGGVFRNRSKHARAVEDGVLPAKFAYNVYRTTRDRFE